VLAKARRIEPWPFESAVALVERNEKRFAEDWVVADRWCVLGLAKTEAAAQALAQHAPRVLDAALYGVLRSALARPHDSLQVQAVG
jgi:hypothetical protein